jgi:hypothetical protein
LVSGSIAIFAFCTCSVSDAADPLPSWNAGPAKTAALEFVAAVTDDNGKDYVRPAERIATFDNDKGLAGRNLCAHRSPSGLFVHHTDADREYAYDGKCHVGTLDKALDQADAKGWIIVDMKKDWVPESVTEPIRRTVRGHATP